MIFILNIYLIIFKNTGKRHGVKLVNTSKIVFLPVGTIFDQTEFAISAGI